MKDLKEKAYNIISKYSKETLKTNDDLIDIWRIKVDGKFITTKSNKTMWKKLNHAKNAFRVHFESASEKFNNLTNYGKIYNLNSKQNCDLYEEQYKQYLNDHVEFIKIEQEPETYDASVAAIEFALRADDGLLFLRLWNEGEFEKIRKEWQDVPDEVFIGAEVNFIRKDTTQNGKI